MSDPTKPRRPNEIDPDAPPSEAEVRDAVVLRDALEADSPSAPPEDVDLVQSLRAAWSPDPLDNEAHAALLDELPTAAELAEAESLRDALDGQTALPATVAALRAAWTPAELGGADHRALVDAAIAAAIDDVSEPSAAELEAATNLRDALASGRALPAAVTALRAAWSPTELGGAEHRAIVDRALASARAPGANVVPFRARTRTARLVAAATTVLALAASIVVWFGTIRAPEVAMAPGPELAKARSTQPLFTEAFRPGETSARIDRIAVARASDYRENRFAAWGLR